MKQRWEDTGPAQSTSRQSSLTALRERADAKTTGARVAMGFTACRDSKCLWKPALLGRVAPELRDVAGPFRARKPSLAHRCRTCWLRCTLSVLGGTVLCALPLRTSRGLELQEGAERACGSSRRDRDQGLTCGG